MADFITAVSFEQRLRNAVTAAWGIFARKVGGGLIPVNKEASAQLQFAYILRQLLPLALHSANEFADIELETGLKTQTGINEVDILLKGVAAGRPHNIAIEMKCYRKLTSTGKPRGAQDIFRKDIYEDLAILEQYVELGHANRGVALVVNDYENFVHPQRKEGKCWDYDTSEGHLVKGGLFTTPIGGKEVRIELTKSYLFNWANFGGFWFLELEGDTSKPNLGTRECDDIQIVGQAAVLRC